MRMRGVQIEIQPTSGTGCYDGMGTGASASVRYGLEMEDLEISASASSGVRGGEGSYPCYPALRVRIPALPLGRVLDVSLPRGSTMRKKLYQDIPMKNGDRLYAGEVLDVTPCVVNGRTIASLCTITRGPLTYNVKWRHVVKCPSLRTMEKWMDTGICKSVAGKKVEPDGYDSQGYPSWVLAIGIV